MIGCNIPYCDVLVQRLRITKEYYLVFTLENLNSITFAALSAHQLLNRSWYCVRWRNKNPINSNTALCNWISFILVREFPAAALCKTLLWTLVFLLHKVSSFFFHFIINFCLRFFFFSNKKFSNLALCHTNNPMTKTYQWHGRSSFAEIKPQTL